MAIKNLGRVVGLSAYETWLAQGNDGTEEYFLATLKGEKGDKGEIGPQGPQGEQGPEGRGEQADWSQNDENADSYIKNRPFYEADGEILKAFDNSEIILTKFSGNSYRYNFTEEEQTSFQEVFGGMEMGECKIIWNDTTYTLAGEFMVESGSIAFYGSIDEGSIIITKSYIILTANDDSLEEIDVTFSMFRQGESVIITIPDEFLPDTIVKNEDLNNYALKEDIVQSDWNQSDETQPDFIHNKPFGTFVEWFPVFEDLALTLTQSSSNPWTYEYNFTEEEKTKYTNHFMGYETGEVEVTVNGVTDSLAGELIVEYGSLGFYGGLGEMGTIRITPNKISIAYNEGFVETDVTFTMIQKGEMVIAPIPEEYLPENIATIEYVEELFNSIVNGNEVSY